TAELLKPFLTLIKEEVNVRNVQLTSEASDLPKKELQLRPELLGPRLGAQTQPVFAAFKRGEWQQLGDSVFVAGTELNSNEYFFKVSSSNQSSNDALVSAVLSDGEGMVTLDTTMTPELEAEGVARDVVRLVQQARRAAGLAVSDRILLTLGFPPAIRQQVDAHMPTLMNETLALSVIWDDSLTPTTELDGTPIALSVERVR
ncbi:MAG: DUF5915 domain-containing protein, partial [Ilumatobacteraceae bacterium]